MSGWELLSLILGVGIGATWQKVKVGGVLDLRTKLDTARHEIWRLSGHPAGRESNVIPIGRGSA